MIRNKTNSIVIKPKMSRTVISALILIALVIYFGSVIAAFYVGRLQISEQYAHTKKQLVDQTQRLDSLNQEHEALQDTLVQLKRQLHIDDSAYAELRKELEESNLQLAELRSELIFYQSIISPQEGQQGVRVQELKITPTQQSQRFKYKLVLIQTLQEGKELTGTVSFTIKGEHNGEVQTVRHPSSGEGKMEVKFKYFQNLTGTLVLPEAFEPLEVRVDLAGKGKKALIEERWYPWPQITAAGTS